MKEEFNSEQRLDLEHMLIIMEDWNSDMCEECIGATVYSYWQLFMFNSLFQDYIPSHDKTFASLLTDGYVFTDFFRRMMADLSVDVASPKYNRFCQHGFAEYNGDLPCAYNVARAFVEAKRHLDRNLSKNPKDWLWRHVHQNEYAYAPWSLTPLKFLWHRKVPTAGNAHTPHVAKYSIMNAMETKLFNAKHAANYKQVVEMGPTADQSKGLYSIDTGNNGNIF